jgi:hypothetical protein
VRPTEEARAGVCRRHTLKRTFGRASPKLTIHVTCAPGAPVHKPLFLKTCVPWHRPCYINSAWLGWVTREIYARLSPVATYQACEQLPRCLHLRRRAAISPAGGVFF